MNLPLRLLLTAAVLFILMIALGLAVNAGWFVSFDFAVSRSLNMQRGSTSDWLILIMQGISWIGGGIQRYILVAILTFALWRWWGWGGA